MAARPRYLTVMEMRRKILVLLGCLFPTPSAPHPAFCFVFYVCSATSHPLFGTVADGRFWVKVITTAGGWIKVCHFKLTAVVCLTFHYGFFFFLFFFRRNCNFSLFFLSLFFFFSFFFFFLFSLCVFHFRSLFFFKKRKKSFKKILIRSLTIVSN